MKPKRLYFRNTPLFGTPLRYGAPVFIGFTVLISGLTADAGDILRGGAGAATNPAAAGINNGGSATPAATDAARANATDTLARTNRTLDAVRAMQNSARDAAINGANHLGKNPNNPSAQLPNVPNGLGFGGLNPTTDPTKWTGANAPTQALAGGRTQVTIRQTAQQALLDWQTLNVGKETTLTFDQTAGGEDASKWIAFNKISDPTGNPTQILGTINATGQVYIINQNGIIFGGSSQVNARGLTASSLPINSNLIQRGLLNNPDAQFLFSGLSVPGGSDGTPNFNPGPPPASGKYGNVTVQKGATLTSPDSGGGNGGRIMLVGPNVTNEGTIFTAAGQTVIAAGLQVGVAAHDGSDPSLRGLDVWIGDVGDYAGTATNSGIISMPTGSASISGRYVNQLGVIDSTTSVNLNGRVDLGASYGAVSNPNFDSTVEQGAGGPRFFYQKTGVVTLGGDSATRILPDYVSNKAVPGTSLPERSQINIEGQVIHLQNGSTLLAPNGEVSVRAGVWPYTDADGSRNIFDPTGRVETGIANFYSGAEQKFFFSDGQIFADQAAVISVAGSVDVSVPLAQSILKVELRGSELADSPLQRDSDLRGKPLTVDLRNSGVYNGKFWIGTPLGDVTGLAGLIERNAAQLTATGGNITLRSGGSIVVNKGAKLDVSGGYFNHEAGIIKTSSLIEDGRLVAIKDATPDVVYDGVFDGTSTFTNEKWGVVSTFTIPLLSGTIQNGFVEGAAGGNLTLTAPSMAIDGELRGLTVNGPRQVTTPTSQSGLRINFESEKMLQLVGNPTINFIKTSPTPPAVVFSNNQEAGAIPVFSLVNDAPVALPTDRLSFVTLSKELLENDGFGTLEIINPDGTITVPEGVKLATASKGSITFSAASISVLGEIEATGGKLAFNTYNISPTFDAEYDILYPAGSVPLPTPASDRGLFVLGQKATLSTAGRLSDNSSIPADSLTTRVINGGSVSINSFNAVLANGSRIDVSGSAHISESARPTYGKAGAISIITGRDLSFNEVIGGELSLGSTLMGYSGNVGGALNIQAGRISVGGVSQAGVLVLNDGFFSTGGFSSYGLAGIGAASGNPPIPGEMETYAPAISITSGSRITPRVDSLIAERDMTIGGAFVLRRYQAPPGRATPVSLAFSARGTDDPFTTETLEVRGDIVMEEGAAISTEAGGNVSFRGNTVSLFGSVIAPGGVISVAGAGAFPLTAAQRTAVTVPLATVNIGSSARLSSAGIVQLVPDDFGRRKGTVFQGGTISITGNLLAESGAVLDVSGTSGVLDLDPQSLAGSVPAVNAGLLSEPLRVRSTATRVDSDGGLIDLTGSQMLLSDAVLLGSAGGPTATGGRLSIFSGNFYREEDTRTGADVNLVVKQSGNVILDPGANVGVGVKLTDANGVAYENFTSFAVDRFQQGSFSSLSLGGKYLSQATPIPYGGNVEFRGKINIQATGSIRLAAGGVIRADDTVMISGSHISVGQDFRDPIHPDDVFVAFKRDPALPASEHNFAPTYGSGRLNLDAKLIDVGTLSLQGIGQANLTALGGDIRGNGTLSMAGDLVLKAAQVYPTTAGNFSIFAYDHAGGQGSVTILSAGSRNAPLSAGGNLSIDASNIIQGGTLRAPLGTIRLGWDGVDLDESDSDTDAPVNFVVKGTLATPVAQTVVLKDGSLTSVSASDLEIPFGISPDGLTWIDPRGVNVTLSGLPQKSVMVSAGSLNMESGSRVDISGGGDLLASRWIAGNGGSIDLLGVASSEWGSGAEYQPGALVSYRGETWSARVRHSGQTPASNLFWSKVARSYAIVPGFNSEFAPDGAFNTGKNAGLLGGAPGYISADLTIGDTITLDAGAGVPAGTYTLLPRGYAMLKGALLVTPINSGGSGAIRLEDGSIHVSGYTSNGFNSPQSVSDLRSRFEIASAAVFNQRANYTLYSANDFIPKAGGKQLIPNDAGYAGFHGNTALTLQGSLLTQAVGRGASVDVSSFSDIHLVGGNGTAPAGDGVVLATRVLSSWGADSLLIGGIRSKGGGTTLSVRTGNLTLDNQGEAFSAPEIVLVSRGELSIASGASLSSVGTLTGGAETLRINGDGTLLRVSADPAAAIIRSGLTGSTTPLMRIGSFVSISGPGVILDSTYSTLLSPTSRIVADALTLGSGQISVVFDDALDSLQGSELEPHLTLSGTTLALIQTVEKLTLQSYRSIDFYGTGTFGGGDLKDITLSGSGVRGFHQGSGEVVIRASRVRFTNPSDIASSVNPAINSGRLTIDAETIYLGENRLNVSGYENLALNASDRILFEGKGGLFTSGNLQAETALITGSKAASYQINAAQAITLNGGSSSAPVTGELGASLTIQGRSIAANSDILLPSGQLTLRATGGPLEIGGKLSVDGTSRVFNDLTRFSHAGSITLESVTGDVVLKSGSIVSVSANSAGGNAGLLKVITPNGSLSNLGEIRGQASSNGGGSAGKFLLDVGSLAGAGASSFSGIGSSLDDGGFFESRSFRIRNGDVTIANLNRSHEFILSADNGGILVTGGIDASGKTGGMISLSARNDLTVASGAWMSVAADDFNNAGKGGSILLEAGTQKNGVANLNSLLSLQNGSVIELGVKTYVPGSYTTAGSSAFLGKFTGTLHLRAPRTASNGDIRVDPIEAEITGASSVLVEGFKVYTPAGGILNIAQRNLIHSDSLAFLGAAGAGNANEAAMRSRLLGSAVNPSGLGSLLVIAPGVEMLNLSGDLILGRANPTGSTNNESLAAADWDLSGFRYGSRSAPGVLTLRASGDIIFNNTLSDGFAPIAQGTAQNFADNGHSQMWLATLMKISDSLPTNTQSWSYRLTAGADGNASDFRQVAETESPGSGGSVIVGEFYPAVPNTQSTGTSAGIGELGQTADTIRISNNATNRGTRYEVVRTGTGDITINAGRDVQLRNPFATIYTAGVALPVPTSIFAENDFFLPILPTGVNQHPTQSGGAGGTRGAIQQLYPATWSMAGGNVSLSAAANIGRYTMLDGVLALDSSRQMPTNWLYRRGYVDPSTGKFASDGGFGTNPNINNSTNINDRATSTTWWIDYSNFFQSVGALGGGNVTLNAGNDIVNVDAVSPTNARMPGRTRNPEFGVVAGAPEYLNLAPDAGKLVELGGGDVLVSAGRNIDGGVYYVERGRGKLFAGGSITTNSARSPSTGILENSEPFDPLTWLPTTLLAGKSRFEVTALGDVLIGPVTNAFLLPQGLNNKYWYKTYFNTFSTDAGANVSSYGGDVTHRLAVNLPEGGSARSVLDVWFSSQGLFNGVNSANNASNYQPWLRLAEGDFNTFSSVFKLGAPNLVSTSFSGDLNLVGDMTLAPSPTGGLELVAAANIIGLQNTGPGKIKGRTANVWTSGTINVSDASLSQVPGVASPLAYQTLAGRSRVDAVQSNFDILRNLSLALDETGSYRGRAGTSAGKQARHSSGLLHAGDMNPVRLYAAGGDIAGLTLFSPKATRIIAERDITDIAFYLQNVSASDITLVSAGRDIVPFNENATLRSLAGNAALGNAVGDSARSTVAGDSTSALAGDIQINGPGVLQVLAGRTIDLGTGANFSDGTGVGITSIGNLRNPFLPFAGADIITLAGVSGIGGNGAALGLAGSTLDIAGFIAKYLEGDIGNGTLADLSEEEKAIVALERFYEILREAGRTARKAGSYEAGYEAVRTLFGTEKPEGNILTRAREIRTTSGGSISLGAPGGGIAMASVIFGNPLTPPGIVTEYGGSISTFTDKDVDIGQARIFTLRGGDITMWSSNGNIAAGTSPKTVVTAPPTRVVIDVTSADVQTDLGGLATGGGIGVLAAVEGVKPGDIDLIAPRGFVDAGDAGIRVTGNLNIAAQVVLNSSNISAGGSSTGTSPAGVSAPSIASVTSASNSSAATGAAISKPEPEQAKAAQKTVEEALSIITVEVVGYGGGSDDEEEEDKQP